jgi:2-polyprenyl-3-methyl-5-hydroxy-6-metoxy-1,4-benzoquinol methylase
VLDWLIVPIRQKGVVMNSIPWFHAADPEEYEHFMGRWSSRLAAPFLEFVGIQPNQSVLDVGCGTGAITFALAMQGCMVTGVDSSETYIEAARKRRAHPNILTYEIGDARQMRYPDNSFDACVSVLAIDTIPEVNAVAAELRRVTRPGGTVASAVFDFWGGRSAQCLIMDTASVLDAGMNALRSAMKARPLLRADGQARLWRQIGLEDVVEIPIVLSFDYSTFDDYWSSYAKGPSSIARQLMTLPQELLAKVEQHVRDGYLVGLPDGRRCFATIIRAVRGVVPDC